MVRHGRLAGGDVAVLADAEAFQKRPPKPDEPGVGPVAGPWQRHIEGSGDAAGLDQQDAVGEQDRLVDVVGDEERRQAVLLDQRRDLLLHLQPRQGVQRRKGLVQKKKFRRPYQRARNGDALRLAAGQRQRPGVGARQQVDLVQGGQRALANSLRSPRRPRTTFSQTSFHGSSRAS